MDLTFQVPMQYCSLQHRTLLLSPVTSTAGYWFCFGFIPSFFLELFLHWSPVAYWAPTDLGSSSFSILSFCLSYCSKALLKDQGVGGGWNPGNLHPFPKIVGIILPLISIWNYPAYKNHPRQISGLCSPSATAHILSVSAECASLRIWINPLLTDHFVSHWILSVMRHQEPELH